jgi:hypothetical protein
MSVLDKLKIKTDQPLWLIDAPKEEKELFASVTIKTPSSKTSASQVVFFALNKKALDAKFGSIVERLADDATLWIAYPKKSGKIQSDLIRDEGWETVFKSELQGVSSVSINDDWTGMRFRKRDPNAQYKRAVPMEERKTEGVDYIKRTVKLPKDAVAAMKPYKGLEEFFYSMSFSHKREYMEAIADAKKPETRQRRIEKMVEIVSKLKAEKDLKKKK